MKHVSLLCLGIALAGLGAGPAAAACQGLACYSKGPGLSTLPAAKVGGGTAVFAKGNGAVSPNAVMAPRGGNLVGAGAGNLVGAGAGNLMSGRR
ncbi:hypothetical protein [Methylobacterium sp. A54F]